MIIIGEKLNSSIPNTLEMMKNRDRDALIKLIKAQEKSGADYLDINTAMTANELEDMRFIMALVKEHSACGIVIDSTNVPVIKEALNDTGQSRVIVNSVTESERLEELAEAVCLKNASVVGLPINRAGIGHDSKEITETAFSLIEKMLSRGIKKDKIYIDVLAQAVSVGGGNAVTCIHTIKALKERYPDIKTVCGISNISFGLPRRTPINSAFLSAALMSGLDAAIMDITSQKMRDSLYASLVIAGKDEYCMNYLDYIRNGRQS